MNYIPNLFNDKYFAKTTNNPVVAVLDTGIDPNARNLQFTPDNKRKIIDVVDCTKSDDLIVNELKLDDCDQFVLAEIFNNICKEDIEKYFYGTRNLNSYLSKRTIKSFDSNEQIIINKIKINHHLFHINNGKMIALIEISNQKSDYVILEKYTEKNDIGSIQIGDKEINFVFQYNFDHDILISTLVFDTGFHGTHVAGIIGAFDENDKTKNGINPYVQIVSLKIGDSRVNGMETNKALINALDYLIKNNIKIANLSYGEPVNTDDGLFIQKLHEAIYKHNIIFITSAGNSGPNLTTIGAPACSTDRIISVGGYVNSEIQSNLYNQVGDYEGLYHWSSRGISKINTMGVDVVALGCSISTMPNWHDSDTKMCNGTSMASPMVTGLVSIIRSNLNYDPHPYWLKQYLINTTGKLNKKPIEVGHGLVGSKFINYDFMKKDFIFDFDKKGCFLTDDDIFNVKFKLLNTNGTKSRNTINLELKVNDKSDLNIPKNIIVSCDTMPLKFRVISNISEYIYGYYEDELILTYPINRIIPEKLKIDEYIEYDKLHISSRNMVRKYILPSSNRLRFEIKGKCMMSLCQIYNDNYGRYDDRIQKYNIVSGDARFNVDIISNTLTEIVLYYPWNSYQESDVDIKITSEQVIANLIEVTDKYVKLDLLEHEDKKPTELFKINSIDYYIIPNERRIKNNKLIMEYDYDEYYDEKDKIFFINDCCNQVYESDVKSSGFISGINSHFTMGDNNIVYCNYTKKRIDNQIDKFILEIESSKKELLEKYMDTKIMISRVCNYKKRYNFNLGFNKIDLDIPKSLFKNIYEKKLILRCDMIVKFDVSYYNIYEERFKYYDTDLLMKIVMKNEELIKNFNSVDIGNTKFKYILMKYLDGEISADDECIMKTLLSNREYKFVKYLMLRDMNYIEEMEKLNYVNRKDNEIIFENRLFNLLKSI